MRRWVFAVICGMSAGAVAYAQSPVVMPVVPSIRDAAFQAEILAAHNAERRAVGVADLRWSDALARDAQAWANHLAETGQMVHHTQRRHGENLYMNSAGKRTATQMVGGWLDERSIYIPGGAHPHISTTGRWTDAGHYTAIVWSRTSEIGCAVGRGQIYDFLVCRYNPPGNVRGYAAYDASKPRLVAAATPAPQPAAPAAPVAVPSPTPEAAAIAVAPDPTPAAPPVAAPSITPVQVAEAAQPVPPAAAPPSAVENVIPVTVPVVAEGETVPVPAAKPSVIARRAR